MWSATSDRSPEANATVLTRRSSRVRKKGRLRRWAVLVCPGMMFAVGGLGWG